MAKDTAKKTALSEYAAKRAFDATPEPAASVVDRRTGPLLFVIQQHSQESGFPGRPARHAERRGQPRCPASECIRERPGTLYRSVVTGASFGKAVPGPWDG